MKQRHRAVFPGRYPCCLSRSACRGPCTSLSTLRLYITADESMRIWSLRSHVAGATCALSVSVRSQGTNVPTQAHWHSVRYRPRSAELTSRATVCLVAHHRYSRPFHVAWHHSVVDFCQSARPALSTHVRVSCETATSLLGARCSVSLPELDLRKRRCITQPPSRWQPPPTSICCLPICAHVALSASAHLPTDRPAAVRNSACYCAPRQTTVGDVHVLPAVASASDLPFRSPSWCPSE